MTPRFKIGDKVRMKRPNLYNETDGEVTEVTRIYQEVDQHGRVKRGGLCTWENSIKSICLPYTFDGVTLTVDHPECDYGAWIEKARKRISVFVGYGYTVKTPKMLTMISEKSLIQL